MGAVNPVAGESKDQRRPVDRRVPAQRDYGPWRAASLVAVYVLIAAHILHWTLAGRTLAPLELNEVLHTLELGIVTAGFLFMSAAVLATAVFGRFFCSWGCHLLALQDAAAWILGRVGIKPKPVRSRVLLLVPVGAMVYMFLWPHIVGFFAPRPLDSPGLHTRTDAEGWGSFVTTNFWRNLPGPWITALTFAVCGFAIVYVLGSRAFCTYACPYGVIFGLADRMAPGKIRLRAGASCADCGLCTAACSSHIRVHQELTVFGKVVSPACLKDLDCVAACPSGNVVFGWSRPAGFLSWRKFGRFGVPYDFALAEDIVMAVVFLGTLAAFRGLYDAVPFLLSLAIGAIMAYVVIVLCRLVSRSALRLGPVQLKLKGRWTAGGAAFATLGVGLVAVTVHSGFIRWHEALGKRAYAELSREVAAGGQPAGTAALLDAIRHLEVCRRFGCVEPEELSLRLASLHLWNEDPLHAEPHVRRWIALRPDASQWRVTLAAILHSRGAVGEAIAELERAAAESEMARDLRIAAIAHAMLGDVAWAMGDAAKARTEYEASMDLVPDASEVKAKLGAVR